MLQKAKTSTSGIVTGLRFLLSRNFSATSRFPASVIRSEGKTPIPFEASLAVKQGGSVKTRGRFTPAEKSAEATIQVSNLALTPLQPYVAQVAFLAFDSGGLFISGGDAPHRGRKGSQHDILRQCGHPQLARFRVRDRTSVSCLGGHESE
jgi:hypothetical protein